MAAAGPAAALGFPVTPSGRATPPRDLVADHADRRDGAAPKRRRRDADLDAGIERAGVTDRADVNAPDAPSPAGWCRHGPAPWSSRGAAVPLGQVDTGPRAGTGDLVRPAGAKPVRRPVVALVTTPEVELPPSSGPVVTAEPAESRDPGNRRAQWPM
ncbi:hypothetical protein [Streptomyces djakartensis]|uniref:Uncharacterized protein n=1 Tax=Streptomyces djakartensis TaxID=68193 RepID=A0ABQ2Z413_9ACTN|nr:hypothetical protein [Streptomyces djakartensis]GGY01193.1 hypothetical protein GCM10010384_00860 [Streptomyces djakartensis]